MRMLIYVPVIHTSADLGSLAEDVAKRGIADLGRDVWEEHKRTVDGFWDSISRYFDSMDVHGVKVYQDGMVADGELGRRIVEETAKAGSKNYQLVSRLIERGALLVKTEDFRLVMQEHERLCAMTHAKSIAGKIVALIKYKIVKSSLLSRRDSFIAEVIDQTLKLGEAGILFIGAFHNVKGKLPESIQIREVKDAGKVRKYQTLLPFHKRNEKQFSEMAKYLASNI